MTWRDAAQRIDAGIATMLASVTDGSVTSKAARRAARQVQTDMNAIVAAVDMERTPTEELREIMQWCEASSRRLAEFEERAEAVLAIIEHQGGGDDVVA